MNLLEINATKLFDVLHTHPDSGLKTEDVQKNRTEFSTEQHQPKTYFAVLKSTFSDVMPLLFLILSLLCFRFDGEAGAWFSLVLFAIVYTVFKYMALRYSRKVSSQLNSVSTRVKVIRDGFEQTLDYAELVPGDIMLLGIGDVVPCDAIVIWQDGLRVSEIQLTGNSVSVLKMMQEDVLRGKGVPYYECIIFAGSVVTSGSAKVLVCNVGRDVFDKKNKLTSRSKHARRTKIFEICSFVSQQISLVWIIASFMLFVMGVVRGYSVFGLLYLTATLAVSSLGDLVLVLFDLTLSVTTQKLYGKGCIIRDMSSLDRMCDISCIIVDDSRYFRTSAPKPGSIYVNDKRKRFRGASDSDVRELFEMAIAASVSGENGMSYNGISIEHSLMKCAEELGMGQQKIYERYLLLEKRPYTDENTMGRVIVYKDSEFYVISIGSPSVVLRTCSHIENDGETLLLTEKNRRSVRDVSRVIAQGNEGVLAVAIKKIEYKEGADQINADRGYSFKGFIGLHTPIKADAARAVNLCTKSGTDVVLMTSEGRSTSTGFAKSLSILKGDDRVIEDKELLQMDMGLFRADIKSYKVYVGLTPDNKADIASYRKSDGDIIAVTASSVDDLRLLLESDVSFCPSDTSDEATRQNSDVIIGAGFDLIPECMKYARSLYSNTRHMLQYILNFQFILLFSALLPLIYLGVPAVSAVSVMTYAVLVAVPMSAALAVQGPRGNELRDTFGMQNLEINAQNLILIPAICGFVSGVTVALSAKAALLSISSGVVNGCSFVSLVSGGVFMAFALASDDGFDFGVFKNRHLIVSAFTSIGVMILFTFIRPLAGLIGIQTPNTQRYILSFVMGAVPALVCVGIKLVKKYVFSKPKNEI